MVFSAWHAGNVAIRQCNQLHCRISPRTDEGLPSHQGKLHPSSATRQCPGGTTRQGTAHPSPNVHLPQDAGRGCAHRRSTVSKNLPAMRPPDSHHTCFRKRLRSQFHFRSYTPNSLREDSTRRKKLWSTCSPDNKKYTSTFAETPTKQAETKTEIRQALEGKCTRRWCSSLGLLPHNTNSRHTQANFRIARAHKVTDVQQDGRFYVLNTGQKVHFERLNKQVPASWTRPCINPLG